MKIDKLLGKTFAMLGYALGSYRGNPLVDSLARYVDKFRERLDNVNFNMHTNGELRVIRLLTHIDPQCVFDVGANEGDWSNLILKIYPRCTIHAFEIVPSTFKRLEESTRGNNNLTLNNFGLSDEQGTVEVHSHSQDSSTATAYPIKGVRSHEEYYTSSITCETRKASDYIKEKQIPRIDFLKIDVEGMDFKVLQGFEDQLNLVRVIQFEYGIFNIASRALLYDFCMYLEGNGFLVGKIYPRFVDFFEYHYVRENFLGNNYLAVRRNETDIIERFSKGKYRAEEAAK